MYIFETPIIPTASFFNKAITTITFPSLDNIILNFRELKRKGSRGGSLWTAAIITKEKTISSPLYETDSSRGGGSA